MFERTAELWRRWTNRQPAPGEEDGASEAMADRRRWPRQPCAIETSCAAVGGDETPFPATVQDISPVSVRLLVPRPFTTGALLSMALAVREGQATIQVLACVVHARPHEDGRWAVGCSFSQELTDEELRSFGAANARTTPPDNRTWARFPCNVQATYELVQDDELAPHPAKVLNISAGGIALQVDRAVKLGALLSADLQNAAGERVLTILACVVHASVGADGRRVLGCNFIRELSEEDFRGLLG
jgi:hypothetical protein